jgi:hypothetical protein
MISKVQSCCDGDELVGVTRERRLKYRGPSVAATPDR